MTVQGACLPIPSGPGHFSLGPRAAWLPTQICGAITEGRPSCQPQQRKGPGAGRGGLRWFCCLGTPDSGRLPSPEVPLEEVTAAAGDHGPEPRATSAEGRGPGLRPTWPGEHAAAASLPTSHSRCPWSLLGYSEKPPHLHLPEARLWWKKIPRKVAQESSALPQTGGLKTGSQPGQPQGWSLPLASPAQLRTRRGGGVSCVQLTNQQATYTQTWAVPLGKRGTGAATPSTLWRQQHGGSTGLPSESGGAEPQGCTGHTGSGGFHAWALGDGR